MVPSTASAANFCVVIAEFSILTVLTVKSTKLELVIVDPAISDHVIITTAIIAEVINPVDI